MYGINSCGTLSDNTEMNSHNVSEARKQFTFVRKSPAEEVPDALYISIKVPAHKEKKVCCLALAFVTLVACLVINTISHNVIAHTCPLHLLLVWLG